MAGSSDRQVGTTADAKARLLEVGRNLSPKSSLLGNPLLRFGGVVLVGAVLGRVLRRGGLDGCAAAFRDGAKRAGFASAPLLVDLLIRMLSRQAAMHSSSAEEVSQATARPQGL